MLLVEQKSMMNLRKLLPLVILIIKVQSTMFLIFGRVQTISFSLFARFVLLEVAPWRIAKKAPASPIFPNSPWNWAPGILSFLPAWLFPPLPWWSLIWGRWQLGRRPTPQEQGEGAGVVAKVCDRGGNKGVTDSATWLEPMSFRKVKVNSHRRLSWQ